LGIKSADRLERMARMAMQHSSAWRVPTHPILRILRVDRHHGLVARTAAWFVCSLGRCLPRLDRDARARAGAAGNRTSHPASSFGVNGVGCAARSSGDFLTAPPPAEKATTRQDQTRQASTSDGARDGGDRWNSTGDK
jgi:hypothetical protein